MFRIDSKIDEDHEGTHVLWHPSELQEMSALLSNLGSNGVIHDSRW